MEGIIDCGDLWTRVEAVFDPRRTDDLAPGVAECVGATITFQNTGIMDEGDYEGMSMWMPDRGYMPPGVVFVPGCDLREVKVIRGG